MNLFSEVYGCYFTVMAKILKQAQTGIKKEKIEEIVNSNAFLDSAFHLLPKLFNAEWDLLEKKEDGLYYAKPEVGQEIRPMTVLELSFIKSLLLDARIRLFITDEELKNLCEALFEVPLLFESKDFYIMDAAADGDSYEEKRYRENFSVVLDAFGSKKAVYIHYESGKQKRFARHVIPYKISYSSRDDKFRLLGILIDGEKQYKGITLNFERIKKAEISSIVYKEVMYPEQFFYQTEKDEPIVLRISKERNALERCMLQFSSWEKQTEIEEESEYYICKIYYNKQDETELLIRVLSFGPVVKVLGPERFLSQIKQRIQKQYDFIKK